VGTSVRKKILHLSAVDIMFQSSARLPVVITQNSLRIKKVIRKKER
jgi:hypothetical protein